MEGDDEDKRRVGAALLAARRKLQHLDGEKPTGSAIIFQVLKEMVDIERRMKVRTASPRHLRAQLIEYLHEGWEREEAARQRRIDEAAGDDPAVVWGLTLIATPEEVKNLESVMRVFRQFLVGKNKVRDWKILHRLAIGSALRPAAKSFRIGHQRVADIKRLQCSAIWAGVAHLDSVKETGRVWRDVGVNLGI